MLHVNRLQWLLAIVAALFSAAFAGAQQINSSIENQAGEPAKTGLATVSFVDQQSVQIAADAIVSTLRAEAQDALQVTFSEVPELVVEQLPYIVAIVLAGRQRKVIVEGEGGEFHSLTEGDEWRAWTIGKIEPTRVEFLKSGESSTYSIFANDEDEVGADNP